MERGNDGGEDKYLLLFEKNKSKYMLLFKLVTNLMNNKDVACMNTEEVYDAIYQSVSDNLQKVTEMRERPSMLSDQEVEKIDRMEMALQASKDLLENMLTPGKKLNFNYEKGTLYIEIFEKEK